MRLAIIAPNAYLQDFSAFHNNSYHLVLAHRFNSEPEYRSFYIEQRKKTYSFIILDNGACELGESINNGTLLETASVLRPDVLVLPDVLHQSQATIARTEKFIESYKHQNKIKCKLMAVVQGKTRKEWLSTLSSFTSNPYIDMIGISSTNAVYPKTKNYYTRIKTLRYLHQRQLIGKKKIHMLGLDDSGHFELRHFSKYSFIEGADSSAPVVHGAKGIKIYKNKRYEKIRTYLPSDAILTKEQVLAVKANLQVFFDMASHE